MMNTLKPYEEFVQTHSNISMDNFQPVMVFSTGDTQGEHLPKFTGPELFWCVGFSTMLAIAVFGNVLVIWIIVAHQKMRTVTNYFLLNLAVADLTMALFNASPNFAYMIQKDWIFGGALCMVNNFVANFSVASSVFTMTAVSIDRYLAIVRPLQPRMTKGMARRSIAAIWFCSCILASPGLIYSKILLYPTGQAKLTKSACIILWPDNKLPSDSNLDLGYNICLLLVTYIIPMIAMALCYGSMSKELWGHKQIGEAPQRQINSVISKRKIVRMFIVVVTSFALCWLPYHAYFIYQYYDTRIVYVSWIHHLYFSFYWLAMSTTMINPIVYYFMNARFRNYIREVGLRFCCCCCSFLCRRRRESTNVDCPQFPEPTLPIPTHHHHMTFNNFVPKSGHTPQALIDSSLPVYNNQLHFYHPSIDNHTLPSNSNNKTRLQNSKQQNNIWDKSQMPALQCTTYC